MNIPRSVLGVAGRLGLAVLVVSFLPAAAFAQGSARSLHWDRLEVRAHLDAEGRLLVLERHEMVFDGDWNGGERELREELGQDVEVIRVARDTGDGALVDFTRDDALDDVGDYDVLPGPTIRWRARLPSDPPFEDEEITWIAEYAMTGVLQPLSGEDYALAHDFAFPDRVGPIESFDLRLTLDSAWSSREGTTIRREATNLVPGESYVVSLALRHEAPGAPAAVWRGSPVLWRGAAALALVVGTIWLCRRLWLHERGTGRLDPLPDPATIDRAWLEEHLLSLPPEVAGALWDESTGAPEVSALLARLELEGKITSRVVETKRFLSSTKELHLERNVPLARFTLRERPLIEALFLGEETTSTSKVREHYKETGFQPATKLRSVEREAEAVGAGSGRPPKPSWRPTLILLLLGVAGLVLGFLEHADTALVAAITAGAISGLYAIAIGFAVAWRSRVTAVRGIASGIWVVLGFLVAVVSFVLLGMPFGWFSSLGLALWSTGLVLSVTHQGRGRQSRQRIERRRELAAAREYLEAELRKERPEIEDEWIPWLLGLGMGPAVDRWSVAHPGSASSTIASTAGSGGGSSGGGFTGGGGSFGGAGASGAWSSAVAGMAAGVAAPSSGGSGGGGGGGGGSSGGGGGGGW